MNEISEQQRDAPPADAASSGETIRRTASKAGRILAYWRWGKTSKLLEAAEQLTLFDRPAAGDAENGDRQ
jgi:hypothetical protein